MNESEQESAPDEVGHVPVMVEEVLRLLDPLPGQTCLDCTVGRGGHALSIIPKLVPNGRFIGLDADPANAEYTRQKLYDAPIKVNIVHSNFAAAEQVLKDLDVADVDLILADLGFASNQMDEPSRGFSFAHDGPLDMRMDPSLPQSAADLVNTLPERELADVLFRYGEERHSRRIARKIVEKRGSGPIKSTGDLATLVRQVYAFAGRKSSPKPSRPRKGAHIDAATRTFMGLRIAVNAELDALEQLLASMTSLVAPRAVAVVISFHSLEDRLVKHAFADFAKRGLGEKLTPKPLTAGEAESYRNPRSRSAKLRAFRFTRS